MSHLARSDNYYTPNHLLADAATGHLVLPFRYNLTASRKYWALGGVQAVSGDFQPGQAPALGMSQAEVQAQAMALLSGDWAADSSSGVGAECTVSAGGYSDDPTGPKRWVLESRAGCMEALLQNTNYYAGWHISRVRALVATVSGSYHFNRAPGAGRLMLGWQLDPTGDTPPAAPQRLVFDGTAEVTGYGTYTLIQGSRRASGLRVYAYVENALPASGPYDDEYADYAAYFFATLSFRVDLEK